MYIYITEASISNTANVVKTSDFVVFKITMESHTLTMHKNTGIPNCFSFCHPTVFVPPFHAISSLLVCNLI